MNGIILSKDFLSEKEIEQLNKLYKELDTVKDNRLFHFEAFGQQHSISVGQRDILLKISAIEKQAGKKALEYYAENIDELISVIETEIEYLVILEAKKESFLEIAPFIELVQTKDKAKYDKLMKFISETIDKQDELIKSKYGQLVRKKIRGDIDNKLCSLVFSGKATNILARVRTIGTTDPFSKKISVEGVNIFTPDGVNKIGVGTAKVYRYAVAAFTKHNQANAPKEEIEYQVHFNINDFAAANGIDINSNDAMKNFRRKLRKELITLKINGLDWTEKVKGKLENFSGVSYIGGYNITDDNVIIEFTHSMAEYLVRLPVLNYPHSLFLIDDRNYNAFVIGEAMCLHYGQDENIVRGIENRLKVKSLLKYTSFPDYATLKEQRKGWECSVKEPFLIALGELRKCGFLKNYAFYRESVELSDDEVWGKSAINSYEDFINLMIKFEINDFIDHNVRRIEIAEKKKEQIKKYNAKKKQQKKAE